MITIYCLVNPLTGLPFYVGATRRSLRKRLESHVFSRRALSYNDSKSMMRNELLKELMNGGIWPQIYSLIVVAPDMVDYCEKYYYDLFTSHSIDLLQHKYRFTYQQHYCKNKP